ncbi:MAG TPA: hypothetical protein VFZ65_23175 [Planctomycetota bacterium]|nr:hypothetical protein [Planctomycetota bacterium]
MYRLASLAPAALCAAAGAPTVLTTGSKSSNYCPVAFFEHQ